MKKTFTINITIDTATANVTDFDIVEGAYNRTEFVTDGVDSPMSVYEVIKAVDEELTNAL